MTDDIERAMQQPQGSFFMDDAKGFQAISAKALMKVLEKYEKSDRTSQAKNIANGFVSRGDAQNHAEVSTNLKNQTGIDLSAYLRNSPNIVERVNELTVSNIQLIKSIRTQYLDKVQNAVMQAMVQGTLNKDLAEQLKKLGEDVESRAMLIARDQSSKLNAALTRARHEEVGIKKYMWSTSGDERVRESHAEKDGQIFEYTNPPADTGHPGHDVNCRCVQIPVLDVEQEKQITEQYEVNKVKEAISPSQYKHHVGEIEQNPIAMEFVKKYNLSTKEAVSIRDYTAHSYAKINSQLREDKTTPSIFMMAKVINNALNKMPSYQGKVWRDVDFPDSVLSSYVVGGIVVEKGFSSSSYSDERFKKLPHRLLIHSKRGKIIQSLSVLPNEDEVLFKSGTKFKVLKHTQTKSYLLIELQEL